MKKLLLTLVAALFVLSGCNKTEQFNVKIHLDNADNATVYLHKTVDGNDVIVDSAVFMDNTAVLTADYDDPNMLYTLRFKGSEECGYYSFFSENHDITISGDRDALQYWTVKGSPIMDELEACRHKSLVQYEEPMIALFDKMLGALADDDTLKANEMNTQIEALAQERNNYYIDYIREHADSFHAQFLLDQLKEDFDADVVKELVDGFNTETVFSKSIKDYLEQMEK